MNIAALSCIHGDIENLMRFLDKLTLLNVDVIVCPGDFTDYSIPRGFTRLEMGQLILGELRNLGKPVLTVPGSWDKDLIDFLKKEGGSVHAEGIVIDDVGFYGYGGARTPFNTPFEPSETEIVFGLERAFSEVKNADFKVQITHVPPFRTKLDIISSGAHVGSETVRKFIEEKKPTAAICAHIHESRGVDEIGRTKIINPGRFPEGHVGLIEVGNAGVTAKVVNLI